MIVGVTSVLFLQAAPVSGQGPPPADTSPTTLFQMFFMSDDPFGTAIIWLLLVMSFANIALMIWFARQTRRAKLVPGGFAEQVSQMLLDKRYREAIEYARDDASFVGSVTAAALHEAGNGYDAMERAIEEAGDAEAARMLRPIETLNILGNISPMIGLFGTVYGMIVAFQKLQGAGQPDPSQLAGGISTALVTTFWGLVVAIPALAAYALIRNNLDALTSEALLVTEELIKPFRQGAEESCGAEG